MTLWIGSDAAKGSLAICLRPQAQPLTIEAELARSTGPYPRGGGGASTLRSPLCSGVLTMPAASIASIRRAARL